MVNGTTELYWSMTIPTLLSLKEYESIVATSVGSTRSGSSTTLAGYQGSGCVLLQI